MMSKLYCTGSYCIESGYKRFSKSFGEKRITMQADQRHLFAVSISANNHYVTSKQE